MHCKTVRQAATGCVRFGPVSPSGFSSLNSAALVAAVFFSLHHLNCPRLTRAAARSQSPALQSSRRVPSHDPADDRIARRVTSNAARLDAPPPHHDRADIMPGLGSGGGITTIIEAPPPTGGASRFRSVSELSICRCNSPGATSLRPSWSRLGERMDACGIPQQSSVMSSMDKTGQMNDPAKRVSSVPAHEWQPRRRPPFPSADRGRRRCDR
jgi:hypothetical protein